MKHLLAPLPGDYVRELVDTGRTGKRMIYGCASTGTVSTHKDSLSPNGCVWKLPIPLLAGHGRSGEKNQPATDVRRAKIGDIVWIAKAPYTGIFIRAVLDEGAAADHAWRLVERGEYRALSVAVAGDHNLRKKGIVDGVTYYDRWKLSEISICRQGANPDCHFAIYNSEEAERSRLAQPMTRLDYERWAAGVTRKRIDLEDRAAATCRRVEPMRRSKG